MKQLSIILLALIAISCNKKRCYKCVLIEPYYNLAGQYDGSKTTTSERCGMSEAERWKYENENTKTVVLSPSQTFEYTMKCSLKSK